MSANAPENRPSSDFNMDLWIGTVLSAGVVLCGVLLAAGIAWRWIATGSPRFDYNLAGTNLFQFWLGDLRQAFAGNFRPRLLVNLGLAVLMFTPYVRVAASMLYFAFVERNRKYALFTAVVLAVLTYSLFLRS